ncbi:hypothetical protein IWQ61_000180 [Dispira simplex]|nr:hypothetical protein IWQ61_000180 [Dispira simplex]
MSDTCFTDCYQLEGTLHPTDRVHFQQWVDNYSQLVGVQLNVDEARNCVDIRSSDQGLVRSTLQQLSTLVPHKFKFQVAQAKPVDSYVVPDYDSSPHTPPKSLRGSSSSCSPNLQLAATPVLETKGVQQGKSSAPVSLWVNSLFGTTNQASTEATLELESVSSPTRNPSPVSPLVTLSERPRSPSMPSYDDVQESSDPETFREYSLEPTPSVELTPEMEQWVRDNLSQPLELEDFFPAKQSSALNAPRDIFVEPLAIVPWRPRVKRTSSNRRPNRLIQFHFATAKAMREVVVVPVADLVTQSPRWKNAVSTLGSKLRAGTSSLLFPADEKIVPFATHGVGIGITRPLASGSTAIKSSYHLRAGSSNASFSHPLCTSGALQAYPPNGKRPLPYGTGFDESGKRQRPGVVRQPGYLMTEVTLSSGQPQDVYQSPLSHPPAPVATTATLNHHIPTTSLATRGSVIGRQLPVEDPFCRPGPVATTTVQESQPSFRSYVKRRTTKSIQPNEPMGMAPPIQQVSSGIQCADSAPQPLAHLLRPTLRRNPLQNSGYDFHHRALSARYQAPTQPTANSGRTSQRFYPGVFSDPESDHESDKEYSELAHQITQDLDKLKETVDLTQDTADEPSGHPKDQQQQQQQQRRQQLGGSSTRYHYEVRASYQESTPTRTVAPEPGSLVEISELAEFRELPNPMMEREMPQAQPQRSGPGPVKAPQHRFGQLPQEATPRSDTLTKTRADVLQSGKIGNSPLQESLVEHDLANFARFYQNVVHHLETLPFYRGHISFSVRFGKTYFAPCMNRMTFERSWTQETLEETLPELRSHPNFVCRLSRPGNDALGQFKKKLGKPCDISPFVYWKISEMRHQIRHDVLQQAPEGADPAAVEACLKNSLVNFPQCRVVELLEFTTFVRITQGEEEGFRPCRFVLDLQAQSLLHIVSRKTHLLDTHLLSPGQQVDARIGLSVRRIVDIPEDIIDRFLRLLSIDPQKSMVSFSDIPNQLYVTQVKVKRQKGFPLCKPFVALFSDSEILYTRDMANNTLFQSHKNNTKRQPRGDVHCLPNAVKTRVHYDRPQLHERYSQLEIINSEWQFLFSSNINTPRTYMAKWTPADILLNEQGQPAKLLAMYRIGKGMLSLLQDIGA